MPRKRNCGWARRRARKVRALFQREPWRVWPAQKRKRVVSQA